MNLVEVRNLHRSFVAYGPLGQKMRDIHAVRGISFHVQAGELYGILGPNGAGKTTTIKMLSTLLVPTSGEARVLGFDVEKEAGLIRPHIGHATGTERGLYWSLSARENLRFFAALYRIPWREAGARVDELLEMVDLKDRADERVGGYSKGMKQRVHVARALLARPRLLFLDEPTIGLDPVASRETRGLLRRLREAGQTTILTTHYMQEAEELCDRVAIINQGRIIAEGEPAVLKSEYAGDLTEVTVRLSGPIDDKKDYLRALPGIDEVTVLVESGHSVIKVRTRLGGQLVPPLISLLRPEAIMSIDVTPPSLEDAYVRLIVQP